MMMKASNFVSFDTSALLNGAQITPGSTFISRIVLKELEQIKISTTKDENIKYQARTLVKYLADHQAPYWATPSISPIQVFLFLFCHPYLEKNNDGYIIAESVLMAKKLKCQIKFCTSDLSQALLAQNFSNYLKIEYYKETAIKENLWNGITKFYLNATTSEYIYNHPEDNKLDLAINEYSLLLDGQGEVSDIIKWDGTTYAVVNYKNITTDYLGTIKPLNPEQEAVFDLLQNHNIGVKLLRGKYGVGKTFIALAHAIYFIKNTHQFDHLVYIRNNIEVAGSKALGALPGEQEDKLMPYIMPLADILGDEEMVRQCIEDSTIEPVHVGYLRGRSFSHSIIFVDESENLTTDMVKLIIARCGEGSEVWFMGDESQTDSDIFKKNNGIAAMINSLKGNPLFGTVKLEKTERGEIAELANKIHQ